MTDTKTATLVIRKLLIDRGWDYRDLARAAGLAHQTIMNICSGQQTNPQGRRKTELALGSAIWSPPGHFKMLARVSEFLGCDPILVRIGELRRRGAESGLAPEHKANREELIARAFVHLSDQANPTAS